MQQILCKKIWTFDRFQLISSSHLILMHKTHSTYVSMNQMPPPHIVRLIDGVSPVCGASALTSIRAFHAGVPRRIPLVWHFRVRVTLCASHFAFAQVLCEGFWFVKANYRIEGIDYLTVESQFALSSSSCFMCFVSKRCCSWVYLFFSCSWN